MQTVKANFGHHIFTFPSYTKCREKAARDVAYCSNLQPCRASNILHITPSNTDQSHRI